MDIHSLTELVSDAAALRRRQRLQPVGGPGDKVYPPTYPATRKEDPPVHVFEQRRVADSSGKFLEDPVHCVLLDSVQSQANRLELALLSSVRRDGLQLPLLTVSFAGSEVEELEEITSLDASHRVYDAIFRDSMKDGTPFMRSELGLSLAQALPRKASALLEASPTSLLFGVWHSQGEGGGLGSKFPRCIVSEIIGIGAVLGKRTSSRLDSIGTRAGVQVFEDENKEWSFDKNELGKKTASRKPSEIGHGNIAPNVVELGVTFEYAEHVSVVTLAGLRRLGFGSDQRDEAARAYLAALGILSLKAHERAGYALRSRCDLVPEEPAPLELVHSSGEIETVKLSADAARRLYDDALAAAREAGFTLSAEPIVLQPQDKLVELIRRSRELALAGRGGEGEG